MQLQPDADNTPKMTDWKNEPTMASLKFDLEGARPTHDAHKSQVAHWNDLMKTKGKAAAPKIKGRSSVQPKLIRRQAEWRYSALSEPFLGTAKLFQVSPSTAEDTLGAKQNELVLNHQFRNVLNKVKFIDDYVRVTVDEGSCVVRLGWKRATATVKETVPVYEYALLQTQEEIDAFEQVLAQKKDDPRGFSEAAPPELIAAVSYYEETQQPTVATVVGEEEVDVEKVLENHPTVEVLNTDNFYVDPSCGGDFDRAMFAIVSFETSKAELSKEPKRYKNLDKIDWDNVGTITEPDHVSSTPVDFQFKDAARKRVVAYEYWGYYDINGDSVLVPIVATWIGSTIIRMEINPFPDEKIPFVLVPYLPVKRELYGETDAELLEDNQNILGAVSRGMIDLLGRSANGQQGFAKGMLDPLNKRKFENGQDYEFNPGSNPNGNLIEHKYPEIPNSALAMLNLQNQEAEALTGVKSFGGGISGDAYGDVAAGIRGVLDAASKREMAILRRLSKGMTQIGNKIIAMNSVFLSEKEVVRRTNDEFVTVLREDLKGNFDLIVDISTAEIDDAQAKDLAFMLQTIGPNSDQGIVMMILAEIAELKRMPRLAHQLKNFKPQPDPFKEQMQQIALAEAQAKVDKIKSEVALNQAKAKAEAAAADKANLDFVEQETGTAHARDLQRSRAQAQGNQDLAITRALVSEKKPENIPGDVESAVGYAKLSKAEGDREADPVDSPVQRDALAEVDPRYSIGSSFYDPALDPARNPNLNI